MESIDKILEILKKLEDYQSNPTAKIILLVLLALSGIAFKIWKMRARKKAAEDARQSDRLENVRDNIRDEDQNASDSQNIKDKLRRK